MHDMTLQAAGSLAILIAIIHGALGELRVLSAAHIEGPGTRRLVRAVWLASTIDWIGVGLLLIAAPMLGSEAARQAIVAVAVLVYGYAAIGNAVATRGRHFGWVLLAAVVVLALAGV